MYYNQYGNLLILIIITIPYYSDGIYVEYLLHMIYCIIFHMGDDCLLYYISHGG